MKQQYQLLSSVLNSPLISALIILATVVLLVGAVSPSGTDKELIIKLQGEVLVLQRQIRDLQESFDKWQGQSTSSLQKLSENTAQTTRDLASIEDALKTSRTTQTSGVAGTNAQLTRLAEQISQSNKNFSQLNQTINSLAQSIRDYQQKLEAREKLEKDSGSVIPPNSPPEALYAAGYQRYLKGDHEAAINYFRAFLAANTQSDDRDNAMFWIAESLASQAKYQEAIREYERILAEYPKGDKATQALFKKGVTLLYLERREEGVATLKSVIAQHPNTQEANLARNELSRLGEK